MQYKTAIEAVGNTPVVELKKINKNRKIKILAKLEGCNPGGSVKDRPALWMIKKAEESGELTKKKIILEPTSGNTGISLAMIGAAKGYKVKLTMPQCVSIERRRVLEAFRADLVITPGHQKTDGAIIKAHEILKANPKKYFMPNQYDNPNNWLAHYESTGPEIWKQTDGEVTAFVAGIGTSGTLVGTAKYLKEKNPKIKIIGVEPTLNHKIQGLKNMKETIVPKIYNPKAMDEKIVVKDKEAFDMARRLAREEGLFVGMSSGAAVAGALKAAKKMKAGVIVVILPDRGDRYLSTNLFMSVCAKCPP